MRMNDFDYDAMQKKRIASGDRHRKRGSKSKFCGLPSDHMTAAQWKKRNGEVKVMNLNQPMGWQTFKGMPNDLQKEYVQKCVTAFGCTKSDFGLLFNVTPMTISRTFEKIGINPSLFVKGKRMSKENARKFAAWKEGSRNEGPAAEPISADSDTPKPADLLASSSSLRVTFDGTIDYAAVMKMLYQFAKDGPVHLTVSVRKGGTHE